MVELQTILCLEIHVRVGEKNSEKDRYDHVSFSNAGVYRKRHEAKGHVVFKKIASNKLQG